MWRLLALVVVSSACADAPWFVRSWQSDEGLPDNSVMGIAQTTDGFLWVATQTGLVRFDGTQFREFQTQRPRMSPEMFYALCADRRGRLWVAKEQGTVVCIEQGRTTVVLAPDKANPDQRVRMLVEDGKGALWASFIPGGIARLEDGKAHYYTSADGVPEGGILELTVDETGTLWFLRSHQVGLFREGRFCSLAEMPVERICSARGGGVWLLGPTNVVKYTEAEGITKNIAFNAGVSKPGPTAVLEDRFGHLWIGTRVAGLFCYDGKSFSKVDTGQQTILCMKEGREGNLWVGTRGGGLKQVKPRVAELLTTSPNTPFEGVQSICQDTTGQLWAIIWHKGTVLRNVNQSWVPLSTRDGWTFSYAKCVAAEPGGGVWIGTVSEGLFHWQDGTVTRHYSPTNGLKQNWVTALRTTETGELWIGNGPPSANHSWLLHYKDGRFRNFSMPKDSGAVSAIEMDASGDCWAASAKGSLVRISGDVLSDETQSILLGKHAIRTLLATADRSLWIGFAGMGLGRLKNGHFSRFGREQGLHDDYISNILADGQGRLWFAGNRGIFSVSEKEFDELEAGRIKKVQSVVFKQNDGLPGLQASFDAWPGAFRDKEGRLFFAMQSGVATVYAEEVKEDPMPPEVVIDHVLANGQPVALYWAGDSRSSAQGSGLLELGQTHVHLRLRPGQRQVEFTFTAPSFTMPENNRFKYRLQGLDKDWLEAGMRRSILYSQLAPGRYCFQVTACNRDGVWNTQAASLMLTIDPFWWETVWFRVFVPSVVAGLLAGLIILWFRRRYQFRIERLELLQAMGKERARIAADLHDEIGANLTHISILSSLAAKPATEINAARQHNTEVTSVARQTILAFDEILWSVNPKNDTLKSLSHFICRRTEEILAPAKITYHFALDETIPDSPVSPQRRHGLLLAVKEALHNILKHADASRVEVQCTMEGSVFVVHVSDNGRGFDPSCVPVGVQARKGHGLENMRRRLTELGGECRIERCTGGGTQISFRLPIHSRE